MNKELYVGLFQDLFTKQQTQEKVTCKVFVGEIFHVINPETPKKLIWDFIGMVFIFIQMITIPLQITFLIDLDLFYDICNQIMGYYFLIDILVSFHTGYYEKGNLTTSHCKVFKNYITTWFLIDIISSFPYEMIIELIRNQNLINPMGNNSQVLTTLEGLRFIQILRLLRTFKLKKLMNQFEVYLMMAKVAFSLFSFFKICIIILCLAHWLACVWNIVKQIENSEINWFTEYQQYENLQYNNYVDQENWTTQYLVAIYFSVTTMITIGYGDVTPKTTTERICGIFMMVLASGLFGYIMNSFVLLFQIEEENLVDLQDNSKKLVLYLKQKNISKALLSRIKNYLEWLQEQEQIQRNQENQIIENLSDNLRIEVLTVIHGKIADSLLCISNNFSPLLLSKLVYHFKEQIQNPEDLIISKGDIDDKTLYYIQNGSVKISWLNKDLKNGQYFGEIGFFANVPRSCTIKASNYSNLLLISRATFLSLLTPLDLEKYFEIKFQIELEQDFKLLSLQCYLCDEYNHIAGNCPMAHFVISKYQRVQIVKKFQETAKKTRKFRKKIKTLLKLKDIQNIEALNKIDQDMLNIEYFLNKKKQQIKHKLAKQSLKRKNKIKDSFIGDSFKEYTRFTPKSNIGTIIQIVNYNAEQNSKLLEEKREQDKKIRTKENAAKFISLLQQKRKKYTPQPLQKLKSNRLSIDQIVNMALQRKPSSEDNRKRLLAVYDRRFKSGKSFNSYDSVGKIQITFPTIPEDAIESPVQQLKFYNKIKSSNASTNISYYEDKYPDIYASISQRSHSLEKQSRIPSQFYTSTSLEKMIFVVINHKLQTQK